MIYSINCQISLILFYFFWNYINFLEGDKREILWNALQKLANSTDDNEVLAVVFTVFRIISRDKGSVNKLVTQEWLNLLTTHTGKSVMRPRLKIIKNQALCFECYFLDRLTVII